MINRPDRLISFLETLLVSLKSENSGGQVVHHLISPDCIIENIEFLEYIKKLSNM